MVPRKEDNPYLPVSPREIAEDLRRCYDLGVSMVHLHARDEQEDPTWAPERFEEIIGEIKTISRDLIIVVTTSGRNWPQLEKRSASMTIGGANKPDMASLTLGSMNFPRQASVNPPEVIKGLAQNMQQYGVIPELEIFEAGMIDYANYLIRKDLLRPPYYFNLLLGSLGTMALNAANIGLMINALPPGATWALAGIGRYQLAANTMAIALGGHVRVGLEDNPYYDWAKKTPASNPRLVERVLRIARELGREPATPDEARKMIGLL
jgi:3-keto-5-aminohexanoate cleavage enzyme